MSSVSAYRTLIQMLLLGAMLTLSACSKEALDGPNCGNDADGTAKSLTTMGQGAGSAAEDATSGDPNGADDGDGRGISDDGDDLSDSEKGRKKKVN